MDLSGRINAYALVGMVDEFNRRIGLPRFGISKALVGLSKDRFDSRHEMLKEEMEELRISFDHGQGPEKMADAFTDIAFVAISGLVAMGVDPVVALGEVCMSNLSKVGLSGTERSPVGEAGKTADYREPDWPRTFSISNTLQDRIDLALTDAGEEITGGPVSREGAEQLRTSPGIRAAIELRGAKQHDYGAPEDYAIFGLSSFLHEIFKKALRAVRVYVFNDGEAKNESLLDSLRDIINWADYAYQLLLNNDGKNEVLDSNEEDPFDMQPAIDEKDECNCPACELRRKMFGGRKLGDITFDEVASPAIEAALGPEEPVVVFDELASMPDGEWDKLSKAMEGMNLNGVSNVSLEDGDGVFTFACELDSPMDFPEAEFSGTIREGKLNISFPKDMMDPGSYQGAENPVTFSPDLDAPIPVSPDAHEVDISKMNIAEEPEFTNGDIEFYPVTDPSTGELQGFLGKLKRR